MTRITYCLGLAALGIALTPAASRSATADEPDSGGVIARLKAGVAGRFRALVPGRPAGKDAGVLPGIAYGAGAPAWFRDPGAGIAGGERVIKGRLSATKERAIADDRQAIEREVAEWLGPDVPRSWKPPKAMVDELIRTAHVEPIPRDLGIPVLSEFRLVYQAGSVVDLAADHRHLPPGPRHPAAGPAGRRPRPGADRPGRPGRLHPGGRGDQGVLHHPAAPPGRRGRRRRERGDVSVHSLTDRDRKAGRL